MAAQLSGKRRDYEGMKTNAWSHTYNLQVAVFFAGFFVVVFFAGLTGLALVCAAEEHAGIMWKAWARVCSGGMFARTSSPHSGIFGGAGGGLSLGFH